MQLIVYLLLVHSNKRYAGLSYYQISLGGKLFMTLGPFNSQTIHF